MDVIAGILIVMLGSHRCQVRDDASAALATMAGTRPVELLVLAATESCDPEVRVRATRLSGIYLENRRARNVARLDLLLACYRPLPYLDALPKDFPDRQDIISRFLWQANIHTGPTAYDPQPYANWRAATRNYFHCLAREGVELADILAILDLMEERMKLCIGATYSDD